MAIQLDFFEIKSEIEIVIDRFEELEKSMDKVRRKLFAEHGRLAKMYTELHARMEIIERNLCNDR